MKNTTCWVHQPLCGDILNLTKFESTYGFVAIDTLKVTLEGMNEKGLTISPLIFESASILM